MSFLGELRRRNVFKVAVAYAIVGWLLAQLAEFATDTFGAPEWVLQIFVVFLILGLPLAVILAWAYEMTPEGLKAAADISTADSITQVSGQRLNYVILGLLVLAVGFLATDQYLLEPRTSIVGSNNLTETALARTGGATVLQATSDPSLSSVQRLSINIGPTEPVGNTGLNAHIAISPDGRNIVFAAQRDGEARLYLRALDQLEPQPMQGTEGAFHPFFSPDGESVVFFSDATDQRLKRVSIRGGLPQFLVETPQAPGGSWGDDDNIVFATSRYGQRSIFRIPSTGGEPEVLISADSDMWPVWPEVLPGAEWALFSVRPVGGSTEDGQVGLFSIETGEYRTLIENAHNAKYVPTGHLVFMRAGTLWAAPFDLGQLALTGTEVPVLNGIQSDAVRGGAAYAFSNEGMLVYLAARDVGVLQRTFVWVDREGREEALTLRPDNYRSPSLSPDGQRLVFILSNNMGGRGDIWSHDVVRGTTSRLTFDSAALSPVWSQDGQSVIFSSGNGLFQRSADGTGQVEHLMAAVTTPWGISQSPDGRQLVFNQGGRGLDIRLFRLGSESTAEPLMQTEFNEALPAISPDGRWIAYQSDETGRYEIYVRPFPNIDEGKWQVSTDGGHQPLWGPSSDELFYSMIDGAIIVAGIDTEPAFSATGLSTLIQGNYVSGQEGRSHAVSPDGQRFLMMVPEEEVEQTTEQTSVVVVYNWFEELNRLAPRSE